MRRGWLALLAGVLLCPLAAANDCDCSQDLDDWIEALKSTPSYKQQIKGEAKRRFEAQAAALRDEMAADPWVRLHCRTYLQRLALEIKDAHLGIGGIERDGVDPRVGENYPRVDAERLERALQQASPEDFYQDREGEWKLVLLRDEGELRGVVLESTQEPWSRGDIKFRLWESERGAEMIYYARWRDGFYLRREAARELLEWLPFQSAEGGERFDRAPGGRDDSNYKMLDEQTGYLFLASFKGSTANIRAQKALYNEIGPKLEGMENLVIDLRGNGGGGQVTYNNLIKWLDGLEREPRLHLLINRRTGSAAEHFTLLMRERGATLYGENSVGAINYRYSNRGGGKEWRSCSGYPLSVTVASNPKKFRDLSREHVGITPDQLLEPDRDWVEQVQERLGTSSSR